MDHTFLSVLLTLSIISLPPAYSLSYTSLLQQKSGPLHGGIQLLIADEQFNAQSIWNDTAQHLNDSSLFLMQALDALTHHNPTQHLETMNELIKNPNFYDCYKDYEREIAHFNRELITKFEVCQQTLNVTATHLEHETLEQINFARNASLEIQRVPSICRISDLKYAHKNHAGIVLCIIVRLGQIDQRLFEGTQLVLDIVSEIAENTDIDAGNCHAYNELKQEFDEIFLIVNNCVNEV